jgi:L-threonine-O-3-phosphate decarboxylase
MLTRPRSEVVDLAPAVHGDLDYRELRRLGLNPADVLNFSANTNPYGPSPAARVAVASARFDCYPDREALDLREALAAALGISPDRILAANGVSELVWLVGLAFLHAKDRVLILGPTFCEYARAATLLGASVTTWRACEADNFAVRADLVEQELERQRPRLLFLCNPNNPTGTVLPPELLAQWAGSHPRTLFVVDEAYHAFASAFSSVAPVAGANLLVLRSMTKDFALAGLRLAYAVGQEELITLLARVQPPWSVNALAQAAGVAALRDNNHVARSLRLLQEAKQSLVAELSGVGMSPLPSAVHFFLLRVGQGAAFRHALLQRGVLVRDCTSFGLPAYVRISTRRPEENARLLAAIGDLFHCPREVKHGG